MEFKAEGNTTVWDTERGRELIRFEKGKVETDDRRTCEILISLGYEHQGELPVIEEVESGKPSGDCDEKPEKTVEKMTVPELIERAKLHNIDLGEAKLKDDIIAVIQKAGENNGGTPE